MATPACDPVDACGYSHDSVAIVKEWYDGAGVKLAVPPNLATTITVRATSTKSWLKIIYPSGSTASPLITSAVLRPDGAGSAWPSEVSATFNNARSVTANSTKALSNVVLLFSDCTVQKFEGLSGYSKTFSGTGSASGKTIIGIWIKSGTNSSGDGPGYGTFVGTGLMIAAGKTYTVTETGLPDDWSVIGLGSFTAHGGSEFRTVQNRMPRARSGLGDRVWLDANANGLQDADEAGLAGVTVRLLDGDGAALGPETATDASGFYLFTNLLAGTYAAQAVAPASYVFSLPDQGGDEARDSDFDASTGKTAPVTLAAGVTNRTVDAGLWRPQPAVRLVKTAGSAPDGEILTLNGPGSVTYAFAVQNTGNTWLKNLAVTDNKLGAIGTVAGPLAPGASTVLTATVTVPAGVTNIATVTATPCLSAGGLIPGQGSVTSCDQAVVRVLPLAALGDRVWADANVNGLQDAGEAGVTGVTVRLLDGFGNSAGRETATDASGLYRFSGLVSGSYAIQVIAPSGYALTSPDQGSDNAADSDADPVTGRTAPVVLAPGTTNLTLDAGLWQPAPAVSLVKTAGSAPDGTDYAIQLAESVTYTYTILNTGNTWLQSVTVTDDKLGAVGTVAGLLAPGQSAVLAASAAVAASVTNLGTVSGTAALPTGTALPGVAPVTDTDPAVVLLVSPQTHERVVIVKEWVDDEGNPLAPVPNLSTTVTIRVEGPRAWLTIVYPAGDTANPVITSAVQAPEGAGSTWPAEVSASFNNLTRRVTATSTKDLSNVVLKFADGSQQKFDGLSGYTRTFAGTGANAGKAIVGVWIKSGSNFSGDGSGYGTFVAQALMVPGGSSFTVTESSLPFGWTCVAGLGTFVSGGGTHVHTVRNQMDEAPAPDINLVKTAGGAADGAVHTIRAPGLVTYAYAIQNTGNTWLKNLVLTDDKLGVIGTVALLAPLSATNLTVSVPVSATVTNVGTVTATPATPAGEPIPGQDPVTDEDDAVVVLEPTATLGDRVWLDADADGLQDAGEAGVAGVTVRLVDGAGDEAALPAVTDVAGFYRFADLAPGVYAVRFSLPAGLLASPADQGGDDAADSDADAAGATAPVALAAGETNLTVDAGVWLPAPAVGLVKTAGSAPDGTALTLFGGGSVTYAFTVRNTGNTWLKNLVVTDDKLGAIGTAAGPLAPGDSLTLTATAVVGAAVTNIGTVVAEPSTSSGGPLPGGEPVTATDPAVVTVRPLSGLGDRVWLDGNANGLQDEGEAGVAGVTVRLLAAGVEVDSAATDLNGWYRFPDLTAGVYRVGFEAPAGHVFSAAGQGGDAAKDGDADAAGLTAPVALAAGETNLTVDAGLWLPQPGVLLVKTAGTAPDGEVYAINGAGSVTYFFRVVNTGNTWLASLAVTDDKLGAVGTVPGLLAPGAEAVLEATAAVSADVVNIGTVTGTPATPQGGAIPGLAEVTDDDPAEVRVLPLGALGDRVWLDADADGLQDAGETGIAGVAVQLLDELGGSLGVEALTGAGGWYRFDDLAAGRYRVRFEVPAGYALSPDGEGDESEDSDALFPDGLTSTYELAAGETNLTVDAGLWQPAPGVAIVKTAGTAPDGEVYTIAGPGSVTYRYEVRNTGNTWLRDAAVTDDRLGLVGVISGLLEPGGTAVLTKSATVSVDTTNIGTVLATPAGAAGDELPGLPDVSASDPAEVRVTPLDGSIGDRVWVDANRNGLQDGGEPGLIGVVVTLLDGEGAEAGLTATDSDGKYLFSHLAPGAYRVRFALPTPAWHFTVTGQGSAAADSDADASTGLTPLITLGSDQHDLTWDAGVYGGLPPGFCDRMTVGENFNALIFGDFTAGGGDTEGRLAVAGTAVFTAGYSVGIASVGEAIPPLNGSADMLIVGGDLHYGAWDVNGNIVYGGTRYSPDTHNSVRRVTPVTFDDAGNVPDDGSGYTFGLLHGQLTLASDMIGSMDNRGVVEIELDRTDYTIHFTGNDQALNVFNVDASDWNGTWTDTFIEAPPQSTVVFNIRGTNINLSNGAIRLTGITNDRILFNYVDALEIVTAGYTHEGAVLAPRASGRFSGGAFEGFGVFGGNVQTSTGFEFHHFPFRGYICNEAEASPSVRLALTAGDAANGAVLTVLGGSGVTVSYRVTNTGNTWLERVRVTDDLLGEIGVIGERLAPGAGVTLTAFLPSVTEDLVLHASVTGRPVRDDGTRWNGYADAADEDDAAIRIGAPSAEGGDDPTTAWQRADFAVTAVEFLEQPGLTGEVFSAQVTVENRGELAADAGRLSLYVSKPAYVAPGEPGQASKAVGVLNPGEARTLVFTGLRASAEAGVHHLRAYVDSLDAVREWSEGDNQLAAVYDLNPIYLSIEVTPEGMKLSWNSFWGQRYTLYRCTDLGEGFLMYKSNIEATPPFNTHIDAEAAGMRFYRLTVER